MDYYRSLVERSEGYKIAESVNRDSHSATSSTALNDGSIAGDVGGGAGQVTGATSSDTIITMVDSQVENSSISQVPTAAEGSISPPPS